MEVDFVPYQEALELKALGFDEPCFGYYSTNLLTNEVELFIDDRKGFSSFEKTTPAPIFSQAFRWFRETHKLHHSITPTLNPVEYFGHVGTIDNHYLARFTDNFEEVEIACLRELIKIVKSKQ